MIGGFYLRFSCATLLFLLAVCTLEFNLFVRVPVAVPPSPDRFSGIRANVHWDKISSVIRQMSTVEFNATYDYIIDQIHSIEVIANRSHFYNFTVEHQQGATSDMKFGRIMHMQRDIHPTVLSSLEGIVDQVSVRALEFWC
jgi:hypothetical protein